MNPVAKVFLQGIERSNMFIDVFTSGMEGEDWLRQPGGAPNCALWHLGHLAHQRGRFLEMLTGREHCEAEWGVLFDLGSPPCDGSALPDLETCRRVLDARLADLRTWLETAGKEDMAAPPARGTNFFPRRADALSHLSHHEAHHTGCLSMLRRMQGKDKVI